MTALAIHTPTWVTHWFGRMADNLHSLEILQPLNIIQTEFEQAKRQMAQQPNSLSGSKILMKIINLLILS